MSLLSCFKRTAFVVVPVTSALLSTGAHAEFIEDSTLKLQLRNFYMNRDFRDNPSGQSKAEDWGQGFMLRLNSGFTEGTVGFGVDALGLAGFKLDSGDGSSGTGALQRNSAGQPSDNFSALGLTAKARVSKSLVTLGTHEPLLPIAYRNDTRLLPQTFEGAQLAFNEIDDLSLLAGQFRSTRLRDSSSRDDMVMFADGSSGGVASDRFNYTGATWQASPTLTGTWFYAKMEDNYSQHYANILHDWKLTDSLTLRSDIRYFDSRDQGNTNVDNQNLAGMFTLIHGGHALGLAWQEQDGDTGMPFISGGTDPWALNTLTYHHFLRAEEDSWQVRYSYDFAAAGIPGLKLMARYVRGDNFEIGGVDAKEWERDVDIGYTVQSGSLKGVSLLWRNVAYRGSHTTDIDENRVILGYTFNIW
ncbi:OprD family porin [Pseudomonas sp. OIL-1]|uniref:OprD family porin n=1 Tax=Pseudomonas sp. OIL-1 TaxID=2706126 RepID=UPI0013A73644|nr:OprD family porin [Pseudomonas sp. OIL-1]QIB52698.1 OprD family porin [Pseudomonas sp. OIL-1]